MVKRFTHRDRNTEQTVPENVSEHHTNLDLLNGQFSSKLFIPTFPPYFPISSLIIPHFPTGFLQLSRAGVRHAAATPDHEAERGARSGVRGRRGHGSPVAPATTWPGNWHHYGTGAGAGTGGLEEFVC